MPAVAYIFRKSIQWSIKFYLAVGFYYKKSGCSTPKKINLFSLADIYFMILSPCKTYLGNA